MLPGRKAAGFLFYYFGARRDSLTGRGTSGEGMVIEDKGMRQRDWCLCVHVWSRLGVCVCVCVSWGEDDWRRPQILGESVIGREMGYWDSGSMK